MNKTPKEAVELINQLKPLVAQAKCDVVVCPLSLIHISEPTRRS